MAKYSTRKAPGGPTPVEALKHGDKRKNIPTAELHDFMEKYEAAPPTMLYPRDPSLDPQLVWKGKDEQDREDLAVPVVPIYIQEKIQPRAIIENVRAEAKKAAVEAGAGEQMPLNLFADFNGIEFEELIEFYQHEQNWSNRMILGDSLYVMTSLAEKEGLKGKVQMIYVDPPYGIRFGSNWQVSTRKRDVRDGRAEDATRQPEQVRAFRDTWELGIHSYLSYLRDRFVVARELLTETGSIFVQIGDENVHLVRSLMDEVFGSENLMGQIFVAKTSGFGETLSIASVGDYVVWYAKRTDSCKYRQTYADKGEGSAQAKDYRYALLPNGEVRNLSNDEVARSTPIGTDERRFSLTATTAQGGTASGGFPVAFQGKTFRIGNDQHWKTSEAGMARLIAAQRIHARQNSLRYIRFLDDFPVVPITNNWVDLRWGFDAGEKRYVVETNPGIVARCLLMTTDPGDLVLDPTCGSGTTAYVAEQWGRRWITIDTSRVALALARTRLMSARYPYYLLADSPEGVRKEAEVAPRATAAGDLPPGAPGPAPKVAPTPASGMRTEGDIKKGFVYRRVAHVTLKSIANNPDIKEGITREEIDAAIKRHAETETLYDQPYEDNKRIRVSGPFTVESLSPHRVLSPDDERPESEREGERGDTAGQFTVMIIDNLRKAGVQNRVKDERLVFERLEAYAGTWIQAEGEYTDKGGKSQRVAVSIGPEHGTVGPEQVKEAAKEALRGAGFDMLVVCGFAFDAHAGETAKEFSPLGWGPEPQKSRGSEVSRVRLYETEAQKAGEGFVAEEAKQYGKLPVLLAKMNPDLAMGDELLKKTGAGNLFMVFGEPDLTIEKGSDGKVVVEIRGVDVYDPTTGEIRSDSTDDIACWFIDTNYNEESFFVRHAYFTGADEPYDRLKRALRAEVDEAAWSTLYSTRSFPFERPETGKIAVKVINHYGDEVLKVYEV